VEIATLYFAGRADTWLDGSGIDTEEISWIRFCRELKKRFAEQSEYDVIAVFHKR
jgi:phosphopantetheinyl transferase